MWADGCVHPRVLVVDRFPDCQDGEWWWYDGSDFDDDFVGESVIPGDGIPVSERFPQLHGLARPVCHVVRECFIRRFDKMGSLPGGISMSYAEDPLDPKTQKEMALGATGEFPAGKIDPDDQGELRMAIGVQDGQVVIHFGKPIRWLAMDPACAKNFAQLILQKVTLVG